MAVSGAALRCSRQGDCVSWFNEHRVPASSVLWAVSTLVAGLSFASVAPRKTCLSSFKVFLVPISGPQSRLTFIPEEILCKDTFYPRETLFSEMIKSYLISFCFPFGASKKVTLFSRRGSWEVGLQAKLQGVQRKGMTGLEEFYVLI